MQYSINKQYDTRNIKVQHCITQLKRF